MFLMTAKLSRRRLAAAVCGILALIGGLVCFLHRHEAAETAAAPSPVRAETDEQRVRYLEALGWTVTDTPAESMQIRIPRQPGEVFSRYNELQKRQGFDLSRYAGKNVMRYVYVLGGSPAGADPVRATLLLYRDQIIGGDVTDTAPGGKVRPLAPARASAPEVPDR